MTRTAMTRTELTCTAIVPLCHLVLSTRRVLATVLTILLQCFLSAVTSLSSASFIPVTSCISSIHFLFGRPLLLLPSPYASIILFFSPSDRITCPKNPSFLLSAVCCSVSSSSIPISKGTTSLVFFSVHDILCIFLHIHISHALIFFPFYLSLDVLTANFAYAVDIRLCVRLSPSSPLPFPSLSTLSSPPSLPPLLLSLPSLPPLSLSLSHTVSYSSPSLNLRIP